MGMMRGCVAALVLAGLAVFGVGCNGGPELGEVHGTVTVDGQPTAGLQVQFEPKVAAQGTTAMGYTHADGSYRLHYPGEKQGAPLGEYIVRISPSETDAGTPPPRIPTKFNTESELTATVKSGDNPINFDLTTK